jgi:hypothetical protein
LLSLPLDVLAFPDDKEMSDEAPRQILVVPPVAIAAVAAASHIEERRQAIAAVAAESHNEEWRQAWTLVVPAAANMPSSLATAASALHRERDHEDEMDAMTFGETAHLKRKVERDQKADDHLFNSLIHGANSYDWDEGN